MKICYIDESGHCGKKHNPNQPVQVLCGVITDISKLFKTQKEHSEIINILNEIGIPLSELKASDVYRGRNHWSGVDPSIRDKVFKTILNWAEERKCKFIVCPIDSESFFVNKDKGCAFCNKFQFPYEAGAFNIILAIQRMNRNISNNKGRTIIIFDEQKGHDENILQIIEGDLSFTDGYTGYSPRPRAKSQPPRLDQVIDIPHFSKSHLAVLIQLADWAAFVVGRYLLLTSYGQKESYANEKVKIEKWYKQIGGNLINHTCIDVPGKDLLCAYFREIRPNGWSAKSHATT